MDGNVVEKLFVIVPLKQQKVVGTSAMAKSKITDTLSFVVDHGQQSHPNGLISLT
jgi:hypothetical protein